MNIVVKQTYNQLIQIMSIINYLRLKHLGNAFV